MPIQADMRHYRSSNPLVDANMKELVGPYRNAGQTWRKHGDLQPVNSDDFPAHQTTAGQTTNSRAGSVEGGGQCARERLEAHDA
jgi:hypothetical protein